jgi:hypothetical protein
MPQVEAILAASKLLSSLLMMGAFVFGVSAKIASTKSLNVFASLGV